MKPKATKKEASKGKGKPEKTSTKASDGAPPPMNSKKVAKAPTVALRNLELALKESSAKKATEVLEKTYSLTVLTKKPKAGAAQKKKTTLKTEAAAAKKADPVDQTAKPNPRRKLTPASKQVLAGTGEASGGGKAETAPGKGKAGTAPGVVKAGTASDVAKAGTAPEGGKAKPAAPAKQKTKPKPKKIPLRGKGTSKKRVWQRFVIDCACVADDLLLDVADFEKYMKSHIKVNQKINNLGDLVTFERSKPTALIVHSGVHFSKRYFKYLAKRYLKKNSLRDWVRVVSTDKETFAMCYFKIQDEDDKEVLDTKA
ncbi:hypothetical protein KR009_003166 [Drosophila setifemur]|nr:hypothetical protein KR009_003166 [Drosophila setifemur]